ncbi:MAG: hypothetical protein L3J13_07705 [Devosiaceae bacterium]|nr:hypothetical protein [Devosiaceae bacterium]
MKLSFKVKGSAPEPYKITIEKVGSSLTALCNCPAGKKGTHCKHRLKSFKGNNEGVVGGDVERIFEVPQMLIGTDVEASLRELEGLETKLSIVKKDVSKAKKALGRVMRS